MRAGPVQLTRRVVTSVGGGSATLEEVEVLSCATCKWAEEGESAPDVALWPLVCTVPSKSSGMEIDCSGPAELLVAPTFGCVQWEHK